MAAPPQPGAAPQRTATAALPRLSTSLCLALFVGSLTPARGWEVTVAAETGRVVAPMQVWTACGEMCDSAEGGQYVGSDPFDCSKKDPSGKSVPLRGTADSAETKGFLEVPFSVDRAKLVRIQARVWTNDSMSDSFWGQLGSQSNNKTKMKWFTPRRKGWDFVDFAPFAEADGSLRQVCHWLEPGNQTFRLFIREPGASVDSVRFSDPPPIEVAGEHEGCSGGCPRGGGGTARFSVNNACGPDTLQHASVRVDGKACEHLVLEANALVCETPAISDEASDMVGVTISLGGTTVATRLRYQASTASSLSLVIGVVCAAGGLVLIACIIVYLNFYRMRSTQKLYTTAAIAEELAEHVANMDLDKLGFLNEIEKPTKTQQSFQTVVKALTYYKTYLPESLFTGWKNQDEKSDTESRGPLSTNASICGINAPGLDGMATIVFTDIQGSTSIWETCPAAMRKALAIHNKVVREAIREHHGYEVKTIGDAFMVAFDGVEDGVQFALKVHEDLLLSDEWPAELATSGLPHVRPAPGWKGLRLRIGVNCGEVDVEVDPFTGKSDYFGHTVNKAARVENACVPGSVCITEEVSSALVAGQGGEGRTIRGSPMELPMGNVTLKGVQGKADLTLLIPVACAQRQIDVATSLRQKNDPHHGMTGRATSVSTPVHSQKDAGAIAMLDTLFAETFETVNSTTVGHIRVSFTESIRSSAMSDVHLGVNTLLSQIIVSCERSDGTVLSLHSNSVILGWNCAHRCSSHQQASLRMASLVSKALEISDCELVGHFGIATSAALYGKVGTKDHKFITVIGDCVEAAETAVTLAQESEAFCATVSLPGQRKVTQDPSLRGMHRPIASIPVPTVPPGLAVPPQPLVVFEIRRLVFNGGALGFGAVAEDGLAEWGWSEEYAEAFMASDFATMRTKTTDATILKIAAQLEAAARANTYDASVAQMGRRS